MKVFCLLLLVGAGSIHAAPLKDQQQILLSSSNSTSHPAAATETLRRVVGPLMEDVNSRITRVENLEAAETAPINSAIENITATLEVLEGKSKEVKDRSEAIPAQVSQLIHQRDDAKKAQGDLSLSLKGIKIEGEAKLTALDRSIEVAEKDDQIITKLVAFVTDKLGEWEGATSLSQISAKLSTLSQLPAPLQATDPHSVHEYLSDLLDHVAHHKAELVHSVTNLTTTLSQQTTAMEAKIESSIRTFDAAVAQLEALEEERRELLERSAVVAAEVAVNEEAKSAREAELKKAQEFWSVERAQLTAIRETVEQILLVIQP